VRHRQTICTVGFAWRSVPRDMQAPRDEDVQMWGGGVVGCSAASSALADKIHPPLSDFEELLDLVSLGV
jgi:hypothetical protein